MKTTIEQKTYITIGFLRDDGDFSVIAQLNNSEGGLSATRLVNIVKYILTETDYSNEEIRLVLDNDQVYLLENEELVCANEQIDTKVLAVDLFNVDY